MINKIKDLEKYYMQEITKVVESIDFQNDLKKLEEYIIVNYDTLREHSSEENKIKVGSSREGPADTIRLWSADKQGAGYGISARATLQPPPSFGLKVCHILVCSYPRGCVAADRARSRQRSRW